MNDTIESALSGALSGSESNLGSIYGSKVRLAAAQTKPSVTLRTTAVTGTAQMSVKHRNCSSTLESANSRRIARLECLYS